MKLTNTFDPNFGAFFPDVLNESFEDCVMVPLPVDPALTEYINSIPDDALYTAEPDHGREDKPHVTVLYGISDDDAEKTKEILKRLPKQLTATLGKITLFETNSKFDVLKIDVTSPSLARLNEFLCKNVEYHNDYPKYQPHVTLAYLKKGRGKPYDGDTAFDGKTVKFDAFIYSDAECNHTTIQESSIMNGAGGGYGGQPGGPTAASFGNMSSPGFSDPRSGMLKGQNYPNPATGSNNAVTMAQLQGQKYPDQPFGTMRQGAKYTPATKGVPSGGNNIPPKSGGDAPKLQRSVSTMQGNTVISNGLVDVIEPEDLNDPRFSPDEIYQGIRQEMKAMEYPLKSVALEKVKQHLSANPKYYSDLHIYNMGGE
jgi:2'-5' RNA ligase